MIAPERRPRGRPRQYDPEAALERATASFWERGFAGTSLDDLASATGMNRPSLYAAFGDKRSLFLKTLERYRDQIRAGIKAMLADDPTPAVFLERFYRGALDLYTSRGCYWLAAAITDAGTDPEVQAFLAAGMRELDEGLTGLFARAIERNDICGGTDPAVLGRLATATLQSLAVRARAGFARPELDTLAAGAAALLCRR